MIEIAITELPMSYYDHAVAMALQLGRWAAPTRRLRPHEREIEAAREEQAPGPEEDRKERDLYRRRIA
ncbi:hypothetical protein GI582_06345 [Sulfitobacter sp. BDSS02]|nr:hypothetical protein [Sulfitobacter sp. BDSS02]MBR9849187.1 hypothetical protein [Paracoccaceae bacterium]